MDTHKQLVSVQRINLEVFHRQQENYMERGRRPWCEMRYEVIPEIECPAREMFDCAEW